MSINGSPTARNSGSKAFTIPSLFWLFLLLGQTPADFGSPHFGKCSLVQSPRSYFVHLPIFLGGLPAHIPLRALVSPVLFDHTLTPSLPPGHIFCPWAILSVQHHYFSPKSQFLISQGPPLPLERFPLLSLPYSFLHLPNKLFFLKYFFHYVSL